jgi:elongation of very long chain fatty acids protein 6
LAELGDTAFIVLRKQKLINLHWIHHVLTLCYCFFVFADQPGTARWMVCILKIKPSSYLSNNFF